MANRKNSIVVDVTRWFCAVLIICAGPPSCGTHVLGQEKQSFTKTEPWSDAGFGGKEITTETKYENGGVTVETRRLDPKGNLMVHRLEMTKPTGESTLEWDSFDGNGKLLERYRHEKNSSGKPTLEQTENYTDGVLDSGFKEEWDETGKVKRYSVYNPALERYEEKELPKANNNFTPYTQPQKDDKGPKGNQPKPSKPSPTKAPDDEAIFNAWWQYFTNDKEGLANLKAELALCDKEDAAAIEKWLKAEEAAGVQNEKVRRAHRAIVQAKAKLFQANKAAREAKPENKAAVDLGVATAQKELDDANGAAKKEEEQAQTTGEALKKAEQQVDRNIRNSIRDLGEKMLEKPKQERADEDVPKSIPCPKPSTKVNETKGTIDSCLIGTWRSESIVGPLGQRGGSGIVMTIKADGTITIDYNEMQSLEAEKGGNAGPARYDNWWRGTAAGHITTSNGKATIVSVEKSELTHKLTVQGRTMTNPLGKLGPALPTGFTCDQTTLKWTIAGNAFTFKRE